MARVDAKGFREALEKQQVELQGRLETLAAAYAIESANPYLRDVEEECSSCKGKGRLPANINALAPIEEQLRTLDWGISEIGGRLAEADGVLMNPSVEGRRQAKRNGVKAEA